MGLPFRPGGGKKMNISLKGVARFGVPNFDQDGSGIEEDSVTHFEMLHQWARRLISLTCRGMSEGTNGLF